MNRKYLLSLRYLYRPQFGTELKKKKKYRFPVYSYNDRQDLDMHLDTELLFTVYPFRYELLYLAENT